MRRRTNISPQLVVHDDLRWFSHARLLSIGPPPQAEELLAAAGAVMQANLFHRSCAAFFLQFVRSILCLRASEVQFSVGLVIAAGRNLVPTAFIFFVNEPNTLNTCMTMMKDELLE